MTALLALVLARLVVAQGQVVVAPESRLWIEGDSNFRAWSCEAQKAEAAVDLGKPAFSVQVPVAGFHCNEDLLDGKLREALKADRFPEISFSLESEERLPGAPLRMRLTGSLTLAGQTGTVTFLAEITPAAGGAFVARGSVPVLMSSYDVEPPSAMLGLVRAADLVTVNFEIHALLAAGRRLSRGDR